MQPTSSTTQSDCSLTHSHSVYSWVGSAGFEEAINDCAVFSFVTQFCCLAAEGYFLMLSVDLVLAVTNPFTNYKVRDHVHLGPTR